MSNDAPIDPAAIENLRALNPDDDDAFLKDIITIFLEDTPQRIAELKDSLAAWDQPKFTRAAHSIKGSSSNLGAGGLRSVAEELEHLSRNSGLDNVQPLIDKMQAEFESARAELGKYMTG